MFLYVSQIKSNYFVPIAENRVNICVFAIGNAPKTLQILLFLLPVAQDIVNTVVFGFLRAENIGIRRHRYLHVFTVFCAPRVLKNVKTPLIDDF